MPCRTIIDGAHRPWELVCAHINTSRIEMRRKERWGVESHCVGLWDSDNGLCNLVAPDQPFTIKITTFLQPDCPGCGGQGKVRESGNIGTSICTMRAHRAKRAITIIGCCCFPWEGQALPSQARHIHRSGSFPM